MSEERKLPIITNDVTTTSVARHAKIISSKVDYPQFVRTTRAFQITGVMSYEAIINVAKEKGYRVEEGEIEAVIKEAEGMKRLGEIVEEQGRMVAWQNIGEKVSSSRQLPWKSQTGREVTPISRDLITIGADVIEVIEGLAVEEEDFKKVA